MLIPVPNSHDLAQLPMILCQILETIVIQIAAESHGGQDQNAPVIQTLASMIRTGVRVDIRPNKLHDFITQCMVAIDVLQREKNGYHFVTAFKVQLHALDRTAIQSTLL